MSIIKLLADFPNYSARKVRRLAKQIATVQRINEAASLGEETGTLRGIEADLMEYNLLQARMEEQANDDLKAPVPLGGLTGAEVEAIQKLRLYPHQEKVIEELKDRFQGEVETTERLCVTPVAAARRALDELLTFCRIYSDFMANDKETVEKMLAKCNGIINGQSFYTDKTVIQARLSPQEGLPLDPNPQET